MSIEISLQLFELVVWGFLILFLISVYFCPWGFIPAACALLA